MDVMIMKFALWCSALILILALSGIVAGEDCNTDGSSSDFSFEYSDDNEDMNHFVKVTTNSCPKHEFENSGEYTAEVQEDYTFYLPKVPHLRHSQYGLNTNSYTTTTPIGFLLSGSFLYGQGKVNEDGSIYNADCCGGYTSEDNVYYHTVNHLPVCLIEAANDDSSDDSHSPLIGFLADGFPIYGPNGDSGSVPTDLDDCGGHHGDSGAGGGYHYHMTGSGSGAGHFGYCFKGCVPDIGPHWQHLSVESILTCMRNAHNIDGDYAEDLIIDEFDFLEVDYDSLC